MNPSARRAFVFVGLLTIGCSQTSTENQKGIPVVVLQEMPKEELAPKINEVWKLSSYYSAISKVAGDIVSDTKRKGSIGSRLHHSTGERKAEYAPYRWMMCTPAEADRITREVHGDILKFIEEKNWVVEGDRELSKKDRVFRFELKYVQGGNQGIISVSVVPSKEGITEMDRLLGRTASWDGEKEVSCALTIEVKEFAKAK
jgi:hypothetical protein